MREAGNGRNVHDVSKLQERIVYIRGIGT